MINIRPVSDLRNKYPEIEDLVLKEDEAVYLTKNGYGTMVVMSINKYSKMVDEAQINELLEKQFGNKNIDELLKLSEEEIRDPKTNYYTKEDVKKSFRRIINGKSSI